MFPLSSINLIYPWLWPNQKTEQMLCWLTCCFLNSVCSWRISFQPHLQCNVYHIKKKVVRLRNRRQTNEALMKCKTRSFFLQKKKSLTIWPTRILVKQNFQQFFTYAKCWSFVNCFCNNAFTVYSNWLSISMSIGK